MYEAFNSQSKNIGDLLGGNERARIVVPRFQRGYSWTKKYVEAFWKDITEFPVESEAKDGPEKYFLGPIVILPKSRDLTYLLDGQQRLATATILFSVMRDTARSLGFQDAADFARDIQREMIEKGGNFSLEMSEMDKVYFQSTVQDDPPNTNKSPRLRSHRNIRTAKNFLAEALQQHTSGSTTVRLKVE